MAAKNSIPYLPSKIVEERRREYYARKRSRVSAQPTYGWFKNFDPKNVPIVFEDINARGTITARDFESAFARHIFAAMNRKLARLQNPIKIDDRRRLMFDAYAAVIAGKKSFWRRAWLWLRNCI